MENLCLVAHSLGLGTCIVGGFDSTKVEQILGIPENLTVVSMTPVGVPASPGQVSPRKKVKDLTYYETFK